MTSEVTPAVLWHATAAGQLLVYQFVNEALLKKSTQITPYVITAMT